MNEVSRERQKGERNENDKNTDSSVKGFKNGTTSIHV